MMYKEYSGTIEFSEEEMRFYGMVTGIRTKIFFHGNTADELYTAFTQAVDSYMEECNAKGILPEKPCMGTFNVRIPSSTHKDCVEYAANHDLSLNAVVNMALKRYLTLAGQN